MPQGNRQMRCCFALRRAVIRKSEYSRLTLPLSQASIAAAVRHIEATTRPVNLPPCVACPTAMPARRPSADPLPQNTQARGAPPVTVEPAPLSRRISAAHRRPVEADQVLRSQAMRRKATTASIKHRRHKEEEEAVVHSTVEGVLRGGRSVPLRHAKGPELLEEIQHALQQTNRQQQPANPGEGLVPSRRRTTTAAAAAAATPPQPSRRSDGAGPGKAGQPKPRSRTSSARRAVEVDDAMYDAMFDAMDANGDGVLDRHEYAMALQQQQQQQTQRLLGAAATASRRHPSMERNGSIGTIRQISQHQTQRQSSTTEQAGVPSRAGSSGYQSAKRRDRHGGGVAPAVGGVRSRVGTASKQIPTSRSRGAPSGGSAAVMHGGYTVKDRDAEETLTLSLTLIFNPNPPYCMPSSIHPPCVCVCDCRWQQDWPSSITGLPQSFKPLSERSGL